MKIVCYIFHEGNLKSFKVDNLPARVSKPKIMGVKIKNGEEMIDATIEMVDGVMVVSPKVEKFEPKDGDVVYAGGNYDYVFIYKDNLTTEAYYYVSLSLKADEIELPDGGHISYVSQLRPATEEEKKLLFNKLKEEGYEWDAEKKKVVKIKWKPKFDAIYYKPQLNISKFRVNSVRWFNLKEDEELYQKGWVFQTNEDCAVFVKKLNQAIEGVKS